MKIELIGAVNNKGYIGKDGKMLWFLPKDLAHFRSITMGHPVVMGRKTYESIGRILIGRTNVILTKDNTKRMNILRDANAVGASVLVLDDPELVFRTYLDRFMEPETRVFIAGGQAVYEYFLPHASRVWRTLVDNDDVGDAKFPVIDESTCDIFTKSEFSVDQRHKHSGIIQELIMK